MDINRLIQEASAVVEGEPTDWPKQGKIEFRNYSVRYRPETELVLKDLNLTIKAQERVIKYKERLDRSRWQNRIRKEHTMLVITENS
jgi:ABC-type multidrug transport system fused ATPase/permease subunit